MGLFDKKSAFKKFIDSITNVVYDNPDLGPEFLEELQEGLVMSDIGIDTSDKIMEKLNKVITDKYITKADGIKKELKGVIGDNRQGRTQQDVRRLSADYSDDRN